VEIRVKRGNKTFICFAKNLRSLMISHKLFNLRLTLLLCSKAKNWIVTPHQQFAIGRNTLTVGWKTKKIKIRTSSC